MGRRGISHFYNPSFLVSGLCCVKIHHKAVTQDRNPAIGLLSYRFMACLQFKNIQVGTFLTLLPKTAQEIKLRTQIFSNYKYAIKL